MLQNKKAVAASAARRVRTISFFAGCGGSDLALEAAGFNIVWANDIWDRACETYADNIAAATIECGDIRDVPRFPSAQLQVGCYPCQGFTQGGRRESSDSINFLYREFDRALRYILPRAFIVENVGGMARGKNRALLDNQLRRYRAAGYRVKWSLLNAVDFGVAQDRTRLFIVGVRSDLDKEYEFPQPTHGPGTNRPYVTQRDVLAGMPEWPEGEFCPQKMNWYYLSRSRRSGWRQPSECIVGNWRHVPLHPMSPPLRRVHTDKWEFVHLGRARRLAFKECAVLQGFPRSFKFEKGTVKDKFVMIGNAVPPPLFAAVVGSLSHVLHGAHG
jgi:DNA (cytosine-5)-methyltransferase 1